MTATAQPTSDSALIERVISGDESALAAIYDRYSAMLLGILIRILNEHEAAEEVLQDMFLQLWRNAATFDANRGSLPAWLIVICRNRAISRLRGRRDRELVEEKDGDYANTFVAEQNIESDAARAELAGSLKAAMAELPAEQRQAVELAYFEGMTQSEIADRTGCPLGTVKTRVRAAMKSLKLVLG